MPFRRGTCPKSGGLVDDNPASFKKDQVVAAANVIAAIANSGMGELYGPGTGKDVGSQKTSVKPEFFKEPDKVKELARANIKEANKLQKVAGTGDIKAIGVQLGEVVSTPLSILNWISKADAFLTPHSG